MTSHAPRILFNPSPATVTFSTHGQPVMVLPWAEYRETLPAIYYLLVDLTNTRRDQVEIGRDLVMLREISTQEAGKKRIRKCHIWVLRDERCYRLSDSAPEMCDYVSPNDLLSLMGEAPANVQKIDAVDQPKVDGKEEKTESNEKTEKTDDKTDTESRAPQKRGQVPFRAGKPGG